MEAVTDLIAILTFPLAALVIGLTAGVMVYYAIHRSTIFPAMTLTAASYLIFSVLMVLTINYRIFYEGTPRFIASLAMLGGFLSGIIGIAILLKNRGKDLTHKTEA